MKALAIALLLALAVPALVPAQTTEEALKKIEIDWANALVKKDFATLNKILADDFTYTDAEGVLWAKTEGLNAMKAGEDVISSSVVSEMKVRIYGDTAVVTGINVMKETLRGRDIGGTFRFTDTFVRRSGAWQCVASHGSKILKK